MTLKRFGWWFIWGASTAAFLLIVLQGAGLSPMMNALIVLGGGAASGAVSVAWFPKGN
ncbi:MAG TPA: hypothetical protein VFG95_05320 [Nitrospiria bacterium]|nr:hypothetical protein [Nitrospiria bacterium]